MEALIAVICSCIVLLACFSLEILRRVKEQAKHLQTAYGLMALCAQQIASLSKLASEQAETTKQLTEMLQVVDANAIKKDELQ